MKKVFLLTALLVISGVLTPLYPANAGGTASCSIHEEYVASDWVAFYVTYDGAPHEESWWVFTTQGSGWTGGWQGISGDTRDGWGSGETGPFGTQLPPGDYTISVSVEGVDGTVCSHTITVPSPEVPTSTPEPTQPPPTEGATETPTPEETATQAPTPTAIEVTGTPGPGGGVASVASGSAEVGIFFIATLLILALGVILAPTRRSKN